MKNSNPIFSIKNFRSFGEQGADFELAPITVLTGCNSAGKSSLVKALMLLSKERAKMTRGLLSIPRNLKLSSKDLCLGGYKTVVHNDEIIKFSYRIWSPELQDDIVVTICFRAKQDDALNEGTIDSLTLQKSDGTIFFQEKNDEYYDNSSTRYVESINEEIKRYYYVCCAIELKMRLRIIKEFESKNNSVIDYNQALKLIDDYLGIAGVTKSEAFLLWNEYNEDLFVELISAARLSNKYTIVTIPCLIEKPDSYSWEKIQQSFLYNIVKNICNPFFIQQPKYINSVSAQVFRLYSTEDDNNKMSKALRDWNHRKLIFLDEGLYLMNLELVHSPGSFTNRWIKKFEIGDSIDVKGTDEGLGLMIYLNKRGTKRLLADEGYGVTQLVSLLMQIDNSIPIIGEQITKVFYDKDGNKLDGIFAEKYLPHTVYVEEPEIHLHPKYQSLLAEMFVEAYQKYNIHFIIETHSEYLIRKLQVMVADKEHPLTSNDVSLNYVEKDENGVSTNRKIEILEDGRLSESFGPGFFDEADMLAMELLKYKARRK